MAKQKETYIKLFHKILSWGWYGDTNTFRVFMHILLKANYKETEYKGYKLKPGDCVFGRKTWAEELGLSERQVRTALEHLKSTNEVTTKTTNRFTIVHVEKWEFWQIEEGYTTNESTNKKSNKRPTSDQQATTPKDIYSKNIDSTTITTTKGMPPTREEVKAYVAEKGLQIDADYFFDYYEEMKWVKANGKAVSNWKLTACTWDKNERKKDGNRTDSGTGDKVRQRVRGTVRERKDALRDGTPEWFKPFEAFPLDERSGDDA